MARKFVQANDDLSPLNDDRLMQSLQRRTDELNHIEYIIDNIEAHKDEIKGLVIGIDIGDQSFSAWHGGLNMCYGLASRLKNNLEHCIQTSDWEGDPINE